MTYIDDTLIRLRRQYSKDEYVAVLLKQISELQIEKGVLQSDVDSLTHQLNEQQKDFQRSITRRLKSNHVWQDQKEMIRSRGVQIKDLQILNKKLKDIIQNNGFKVNYETRRILLSKT